MTLFLYTQMGKHILYLHLWLALIALLLTMECVVYFSIPIAFYPFACFSATATLFAYNAHTLLSINSNKKTTELTSWAKKHYYHVVFFTLVGFLGCVFFSVYYFSLLQWEVLMAAGVIWILYESVIAFVNKRGLIITNNYSLLKSLVLAFVWTVITVILPLTKSTLTFEGNAALFVLIRFCLFALISQLFEYRDLYTEKLNTGSLNLVGKTIGYTNLTLLCNFFVLIIGIQLIYIEINFAFKLATSLQLIAIIFFIRIKNIVTITPSMLLWDGILIVTPLCSIPFYYL